MIEWTGERYVPGMEGAEIGYEHLHRYAFATQFVRNKRVLDLASGEGYGSNLLAKTAKQVVGIDIDEQAVRHAISAATAWPDATSHGCTGQDRHRSSLALRPQRRSHHRPRPETHAHAPTPDGDHPSRMVMSSHGGKETTQWAPCLNCPRRRITS